MASSSSSPSSWSRSSWLCHGVLCFLHLMLTLHTVVRMAVFFFATTATGVMRHSTLAEMAMAFDRDDALALLKNGLLLALFLAHHTLWPRLLGVPSDQGPARSWAWPWAHPLYARMVYVFGTNLTLLCLVHLWERLPSFYLWRMEVDSPFRWWMFFLVHALAWYVIYAGSIIMDLTDIVGVHQIFEQNMCPFGRGRGRSPQLQRFLSHLPHGSFTGFNLLLWVQPQMTLDRLILALALDCYMYIAWRPDRHDWEYQRRCWRKKTVQF